MAKKITLEKFIEKASIKHNNKYDYSLSVYKNTDSKIKIICPIEAHGIFEQTPYRHLNSKGCQKCSGHHHVNTNEFIKKANEIHSLKYDYAMVNYKNCDAKVNITCMEHGAFFQTPYEHLSGKGCPTCAGNVRSNSVEFSKKASSIHNHKYDYSKVKYINAHSKIIIICPDHGKFTQKPNNHLSGKGCIKCAGTDLYTLSQFIDKANYVHNNKYNYSKSNYTNIIRPIIIDCSKHGEFSQSPHLHLRGKGCPRCAHIISKLEVEWINSFNDSNIKTKCRITICDKIYKPDGIDFQSKKIYEFYGDYWHGNPNVFPPDQLNKTVNKTFAELYNKTMAKEEEYKNAGYEIISIWETDFHKKKLSE